MTFHNHITKYVYIYAYIVTQTLMLFMYLQCLLLLKKFSAAHTGFPATIITSNFPDQLLYLSFLTFLLQPEIIFQGHVVLLWTTNTTWVGLLEGGVPERFDKHCFKDCYLGSL